MPKRFQRIILIIISLIFLLTAVILVLFNIKNNIVFFLTPTEILTKDIKNNNVRIGGMVKKNSYKFNNNTNENIFTITDFKNEIKVNYTGILPDLFKEDSGVVAEGKIENNILKAKKIFAKHDENYMPRGISEELKKSGYWNKNYK